MNDMIKAVLLAIAGFCIFSLGDVAGKHLTVVHTPFEIAFWSAGFSLLLLLLLSDRLGGLRRTLNTRKRGYHILRAVLTGLMPPLVYYGLETITLVNFYTLVFIAPFLTAILSALVFKEQIPPVRWVLIALGMVGIIIALRPDVNGVTGPEIAVLAAASAFAIRNLLIQKMGTQETLLSFGFYPYLGIFLMAAPFALNDFHLPDIISLGWLAFIGGGSALGLIALSHAFLLAPASLIAPMHYTQLIWGMIFGMIVFNDYPGIRMLFGAAIVTFCGIVLIVNERRAERRRKTLTPPDARILPP